MSYNTLLIDCPHCQARVGSRELDGISRPDEFAIGNQVRYVFLQCQVCKECMVGLQEFEHGTDGELEWGDCKRLWPDGESHLSSSIPHEVRLALHEALVCYRAKIYGACAVMCGKAIEAMCKAHGAGATLSEGLRKLRDSNVIDIRLYEWGESLRKERNIGAHATGVSTTQMDARDVMDFAVAICEYVYVLADKYEKYQKRKTSS